MDEMANLEMTGTTKKAPKKAMRLGKPKAKPS